LQRIASFICNSTLICPISEGAKLESPTKLGSLPKHCVH